MKVQHTQKPLESMAVECFVRGKHPEAEKLNLRNCKLALGEANGEAMLLAATEDLPEVIYVGGEVLANNENVIHVDKTEGKLTHEEVHHTLKGVLSFLEAKGPPHKLKHSKGGDNSCLLNVL